MDTLAMPEGVDRPLGTVTRHPRRGLLTGASAKAKTCSTPPPRSAASPASHSLESRYCCRIFLSALKRGSWRVASFWSALPIEHEVLATTVMVRASHRAPAPPAIAAGDWCC